MSNRKRNKSTGSEPVVPGLDLAQAQRISSLVHLSESHLSESHLSGSPLRESATCKSKSPLTPVSVVDTSFNSDSDSEQSRVATPKKRHHTKTTPISLSQSQRYRSTSISDSHGKKERRRRMTMHGVGFQSMPNFHQIGLHRAKVAGSLSPRAVTPILSPRNPPPRSPRTPRGSIRTSYMDAIRHVQRRNAATYSPRPAEILGLCRSGEPICFFYGVQSRKEVGRRLIEHPRLWKHLLKTICYTGGSSDIQPEILYDLLNGLEIVFKLSKMDESQVHRYEFVSLPLNEIRANVSEKRYITLMKDGQVQEVMDCHDPDLLVQNFKHNYYRYVPIFKWFQEHGFQDFMKSPRQNLFEIVRDMGVHKLYGYIENTSVSNKSYVKLKVVPVY